ncbi:hypothetical protein A2634_00135 [Candidatus Amesbacteria bacterium RIFCSPHIGHO2_01_FULL_48_32]|uniref:DUF1573 domain-containing protein n=1 Tax=Candidatus Amesbacteria bacterium RIFCSPLOWO2_01_FULL_48_25 TaxID=1797259 RepID=A0A1F4ZBG7_9BACT|nr:MAG: hypothetical protein A2634_00135 [Candidatus Amesbacteria bacterium RIFCSPHIGHO2_01_FULL_48_32]OGD03217.1 MAG: hypothetical protein A2989_00085 [Candidatus Amesbacteria bacterium RIFCSPLOWO2_01_FULL_48_25]HJZ05530.1 DUF1573 domain-containing protein [Patescibacteria group bacterium]
MNIKIVIIGVLLTAILVGGGVVVMSRSPNAASLEKTDKTKFFTDHTNFDWGKINYNGGVVNHVFEIKNSGESSLKLANIKTSCMCTTAKISTKNGAGPTVKMHEVSDWQGVLEPGETAQLEVVFDPAFHGPTGVGPVERIISVETSDPNKANVEFNLKGVVTRS